MCIGGFGSDYAVGRGGGPVKSSGFGGRAPGPYAGFNRYFLHETAYSMIHSVCLACYMLSSVCLSTRPSVTRVDKSKMAEDRNIQFSPYGIGPFL